MPGPQEAPGLLARACALDRRSLGARVWLSNAQFTLQQVDAAIGTVREAIALAPEEASLRAMLGRWLAQRGSIYVRAGQIAGGTEAIYLAALLQYTGRWALIARLGREVLGEAPPPSAGSAAVDPVRGNLLQVAPFGAVALAGDPSLTPQERGEWRRRGAAWLLEYAERLPRANLSGDARILVVPARWFSTVLAPIRDEEQLADAPPEDREACRRAWEALRAYHDSVK